MDLKSIQRPFKERYRSDPQSSRITLTARGTQTETPISCSVDIGRALYQAQAHQGVGGAGTSACSGDLIVVPVGLFRARHPSPTPGNAAGSGARSPA